MRARLDQRLFARYLRGPNHPGKLRLLGWLADLGRPRSLVLQVADGVVMQLDARDYVQREIIYRGGYEPRSVELFERLLARARGCVDFGAHMGLYSLRAAARLAPRGGKVLAVEPTPAHAAALQRNAELSGLTNLEICTAAFASKDGIVRMIAPHASNTGGSRLAAGADQAGDLRSLPLHVPVLSGDRLAPLAAGFRPDLVKLDVEGHEFAVLRGFLPALPEAPNDLLLECKPEEFDYGDLAEHLAWMAARGYRPFDVTGRPWDGKSPLTEDNLWLSRSPHP